MIMIKILSNPVSLLFRTFDWVYARIQYINDMELLQTPDIMLIVIIVIKEIRKETS